MSNSTHKMDVTVGPTKYGKEWVKVKLKYSNTFLVSFEDLHRIIQAIGYCEDKKYPSGEGRKMVADFLYDCVFESDFSELQDKYRLPARDGETVIDDNGAKYNPETFIKTAEQP